MDSSIMTISWSTALLRMDTIAAEFAPSLELPLKTFRTCLPPITIAGLGAVVWWRSRRDQGQMRRHIEVTIEMPTPYTLLCVLGYLTAALFVLDIRILTLLLPLALAGACSLRLSTPKPTDDGSPPKTTLNEPLHSMTPPSSRRPRRLFHIHDEIESPLTRKTNQSSLLLTPPATVPRRRHISYEPQTPPILRTERPSFRTRVSSTPSDEIRRTRKGSTNRRYASESCEENLVPKKEVWDTSFELLLYNLSKSRKSPLVEPQPRFDVSSPISPLDPSPLMNSS